MRLPLEGQMYIASLLVLLGEGKIKSLANEERKWERAIGNISKAINFSHCALLRNCWQHTGDTLPHGSVRDLLHMILWDHLVSLSSVGTEIPHVGVWSHLPSAAVVAVAWELEKEVKKVPVGRFGEELSSVVGQAGHWFLLSFALCGQSWDKRWHPPKLSALSDCSAYFTELM